VAESGSEVEISGEQASAPEILESVIESAQHEMQRGTAGLLLSGLSAGLDIGFGPLLMAVVLTVSEGGYGDLGTELLLASAYSVGFIFVIVARSELFTEHTTLAVMPVLDNRESLGSLGRLWGLIWFSNVVGGAVFALVVVVLMPNLGVANAEAFVTIARKMVSHEPQWLFVAGILAGWLMGLLAWLITAAKGTTSRLLVIWIVTASIGMLHLPHSIAGNVEVLFGLFISAEITVLDYATFLGIATVGNVVGGSVFVSLLKYGHVVRGGG
jgi:formate/nitrite transporter FocA (FNT family)